MIGDVNAAATGRTTSNEPLGRPRRAVAPVDPIERHAEEIIRLVKGMDDGSKPHDVHHLRTTIRRFETVLPEDGADASRVERKLRKQLDRLRRCAGKVRDVDVHLKALRTLPPALAEARATVRVALQKARAKKQKRLLRALDAERDRGLVKRLRAVVAHPSVGRVDPADTDTVLTLVLGRFSHALAGAAPLGRENLHDFRIETKRVRYLAEAVTPNAAVTSAVTELKRVQDAIGAWHDWLTLREEAASVLDDVTSPLVAAIETRVETALGKAVTTTVRVGRRLQQLQPNAARKGVRRITRASSSTVPQRSAGATA